jgi:predicted nucleotide-binding protein (sugar kinase/HSP70/actin superfamily)
MKIGIPKGLLNDKYYPFLESFFSELGAEIVTSPGTNKTILDEGTKYCVDEACLPVKVFHGHVAAIRDKCDALFIPRIMGLRKGEFICPKFCGLPEMILNSINNMPLIINSTIDGVDEDALYRWAREAGKILTGNTEKIKKSLKVAVANQSSSKIGIKDEGYKINIALAGHPYNVHDKFSNMNVVRKLNKLGIGVVTEENIESSAIDYQVNKLFKKPFWTFARNSYGFTTYVGENKLVDGIIYISSFACGIDSIVLELIKERLEDFPILILKIDEHTGEAGIDTRIEAFVDMLERR